MSKSYKPKVQSGLGQLFDSLFILLLVYVSLYIPLLMESEPEVAAETAVVAEAPTWESLQLTPVVQEQWQKLGLDAEGAAAIISDKFDYTIDPLMLVITALVIIGYFAFMLRVSDKQYREVIAEKFDDR